MPVDTKNGFSAPTRRRFLTMAGAAGAVLRPGKPSPAAAQPEAASPPITFVMNENGQVLQNDASGKARWVSVTPENSQSLLQDTHADTPHAPASLTKLMTEYILLNKIKEGKLKLSDVIEVSGLAAEQAKTNIGLKAGDTISIEQALKAVIVHSANDCAVVLANAIAGTIKVFKETADNTTKPIGQEKVFVEEMNKTAKDLGMNNTHFVNSSGLPAEGQSTTAHDLAILTNKFKDFVSEYGELFKTDKFYSSYDGKTYERSDGGLINRDLEIPAVKNVFDKTGYIETSGCNMSALVQKTDLATNKPTFFTVVVLGAKHRDAREKLVLDRINAAASAEPAAPVASNKNPSLASSSPATERPATAATLDQEAEVQKLLREARGLETEARSLEGKAAGLESRASILEQIIRGTNTFVVAPK